MCTLCTNFNVESPFDHSPTGDLVKPGENARASINHVSKTSCDGIVSIKSQPILRTHILIKKKVYYINESRCK